MDKEWWTWLETQHMLSPNRRKHPYLLDNEASIAVSYKY
jgi:hypothetical protein